MNVTICKEIRLAVAHNLPHHDGKCRFIHGHTYVVRVYVRGPVQAISSDNPQSGMVTDFGVIKKFLQGLDERLDHQNANDSFEPYPTAERLAVRILDLACNELGPVLPINSRVLKVRVYEEYVAPQAFAEVENMSKTS